MVQLRVQPVREEDVPRDTFVSIRFGQTQKLSRLEGSRSYKFAQTGDVRYGKIEVFRRIGVASLDMYQACGAAQDINVNCSENELGELGLKVMVEPDEKEAKQIEAKLKESEADKLGVKVKSAKQYLNKHGLELQLSEAMQDILRDRPENPAQFLANRLMKKQGDAFKLPPIDCTKTPHQMDNANVTVPLNMQKNLPVRPSEERITITPRSHTTRPQKLTPLGTPSTTDSAPLTPEQERSERRAVQQPNVTDQTTQEPSVAPSSAPRMVKPWVKAPSVGTWMLHLRKAQVLALSSRSLPVTVDAQPPQARASSGFRFKPSVGTWCTELAEVAHEEVDGLADKPLAAPAMRQSVCTWLTPLTATALPEKEVGFLQWPQGVVFKQLPSVGAWLAPAPAEAEDEHGLSDAAAIKLAPPPEGGRVCMRPSVASWLVPAPVEDPEEGIVVTPQLGVVNTKEYKFRPSVGAWLGRLPVDTDADFAQPTKQRSIVPLQQIMGPSFYSLGCRPGVMLV